MLVEGVKTSSEVHECGAHDRSWGASGEDAVGVVHALALGAASFVAVGPPSSGSLHVDAASVLKALWQGCDGKWAGGQLGDVVELGQLH